MEKNNCENDSQRIVENRPQESVVIMNYVKLGKEEGFFLGLRTEKESYKNFFRE